MQLQKWTKDTDKKDCRRSFFAKMNAETFLILGEKARFKSKEWTISIGTVKGCEL